MRCEVCGRKIHGQPYKVIIEGARMTVCTECSKHGKLTWEEEPKQKPRTEKKKTTIPTVKMQAPKRPEPSAEASVELVEGFDSKIRQAREKLGVSHGELGKKLNEKISRLKKIETGKLVPDNVLATKLEHALKIKLIVPASGGGKAPEARLTKTMSREVTLGDLVKLEKQGEKGKEATAERKRS